MSAGIELALEVVAKPIRPGIARSAGLGLVCGPQLPFDTGLPGEARQRVK
ncbi:hypothetical protein ACIBL3_05880 [Kribbella sp. NPDC050124]